MEKFKSFGDYYTGPDPKIKRDDDLKEKILTDIRSKSHYFKHIYANFSDESFNRILEFYALHKQHLIQCRRLYEGSTRTSRDKMLEFAEKALMQIQAKKLFDAELLWRAGQLDLPVLHDVEFKHWHQHLESCPLIPPINEFELEMYADYLDTPECNVYEVKYGMIWLDFRDTKDILTTPNHPGLDDLMQWIPFHAERTNTKGLWNLPDLYEKASWRLNMAARERDAKEKGEPWPPPEFPYVEPQPYVHIWHNSVDEFRELALHFESPDTRQRLENYMTVSLSDTEADKEAEHQLETVWFSVLYDSKEYIPVGENADWRHGLVEAAHAHMTRKIKERLAEAFENYQKRIKRGFPPISDEDYYLADARTRWIESNIRGREFLGEPADPKFWPPGN
jgi:hypothetical protein